MTESETKALEKKHMKALKAFYKSRGVGRTNKQKLAFWESQPGYVNGYSISHVPEDPKKALDFKVAVMEMVWVANEFPQDMTYA